MPDRPTGAASQAAVRVRAPLLERLVNQAGEVSITRSRIESEVGHLKASLTDLTENLDRLRGQLRDIELQAETQMASRMEATKAAAASFDPLEPPFSGSRTRSSRASAARSRTSGPRTTTALARSPLRGGVTQSASAASRRRRPALAVPFACAYRELSIRRWSRRPPRSSGPRSRKIHFADPRTAFMSTVTAKLGDAGRYRELLVEQLTAPVKFTQAAPS